MVESQRHEDKDTTEQHFFVSSLKPDTDKIAPAIRPHCKIENGCHWVLDVTFREDDSADPPTPGSGDCRRCATSRTSVHVAWPHGRAVTPRRESIPGGSVAASLLLTGVTTQPCGRASRTEVLVARPRISPDLRDFPCPRCSTYKGTPARLRRREVTHLRQSPRPCVGGSAIGAARGADGAFVASIFWLGSVGAARRATTLRGVDTRLRCHTREQQGCCDRASRDGFTAWCDSATVWPRLTH